MNTSTEKCGEHSKKSTPPSAKPGLWARLLILAVRIYQTSLSPMLGGGCRYYPSCSEYAIDAVERYGARKGSIVAGRRLLRCHPWHAGGYDPVESGE